MTKQRKRKKVVKTNFSIFSMFVWSPRQQFSTKRGNRNSL